MMSGERKTNAGSGKKVVIEVIKRGNGFIEEVWDAIQAKGMPMVLSFG